VTVGYRWTKSTISSQALVCNGPIIVGICFGTIVQVSSVETDNSSGYTLKAVLDKRFETDTVSGRLSSEVYPSGLGSLVETDRIGASWVRQWTPALTTTADAAAYQSQYIGGVVTDSNNRYYTASVRMSWRIAESWTVNAGYAYARQKYDSVPVAASQNVAFVALVYGLPRWSISR